MTESAAARSAAHRRPRGLRAALVAAVLVLAQGLIFVGPVGSVPCSISTPGFTTNRQITVDATCQGAKFFKLSETPDFRESAASAPTVTVTSVSPTGDYADLDVVYPGGLDGPPSQPFGVSTQTSQPKVLVVLFDFAGEMPLPAYATPAWARKLVFDGNFDGRNLPNSVRSYLQQNTYGTVNLDGAVYPGVLHLEPFSTVRDPGLAESGLVARKVADKLAQTGFITAASNPYDMLLGLTAGGMFASGANTYDINGPAWNTQGFDGNLVFDVPVYSDSPLIAERVNEPATVTGTNVVIPRYNPGSVTGVWAATDPGHVGPNYFASLTYAYQDAGSGFANGQLKYVKTNQPLAPGTSVIVSYRPQVSYRVSDELRNVAPPATLLDDNLKWFGTYSHEFMHAADWLYVRPPADPQMPVLDMYQQPGELTREYDMMASGNSNTSRVFNPALGRNLEYADPSHLNGHTKMQAGILTPHTLTYGRSQTGLRIYRTEEADFAGTQDRVKLVKVPLHPPGDKGFLQLVASQSTVRKYGGEEYLTLEWRSKRPLAGGAHNFDVALPHEGLVVYRSVEGSAPAPFLHGWDQTNSLRIQDATPPRPPFTSLFDLQVKLQTSIWQDPAPFGPASGVFQYVASDPLNWKEADTAQAAFQLSADTGPKTVYARFLGLDGSIVASTSTTVALGALGGRYTPLTPARLLDTRNGTGGVSVPIGPAATIDVQVAGRGGVPVAGAAAVAINVTATQPTASGFLTLFPTASPRPLAANLNFVPAKTVPNLVVVKLGPDGRVSMFNSAGTTDVIVDVAGWYSDVAAGNDGRYSPLVPARILDTRDGTGGGARLGPGASLNLQVTGRGGVPATGVGAAVLNVAVTRTTATSFLTVHPAGVARPLAASLNFVAGDTVSNRVMAKVGSTGMITIYNNSGSADVVVDVGGWYSDATVAGTAGTYVPLQPARVLDTRDATGAITGPIGAGASVDVQLTGRGGVPASGVSAVILNATVIGPASAGYLTISPTGTARPLAADLNFGAGETRPNLVVVRVGPEGRVALFSSAGTHVAFDVAGWFSS